MKQPITYVLVGFLLISSTFARVYDDPSIVTIADGPLRGNVFDDHREFLGVPFAKPPVGDLRWSNPLPNVAWGPSVYNATKFSDGCPQHCILPPHTCPEKLSEDCLYLNVYTPPNANPNSKLPVLVFFPGGRFEQGTAGCDLYPGGHFVNKTGVIMVTSNYRLGALGWLVTSNLKGNFAFFDQRLALQWVQKNIAAFGGDPTQVTLSGQSAGASSTTAHLIAPNSAGLFSKAIIQSNPVPLPLKTVSVAHTLGKKFCKDIGCADGDMNCLRSKTPDQIVAAQDTSQTYIPWFRPLDLFLPWTPVVDGNEIPMEPMKAFAKGAFTKVPIMLGTVLDDALLFIYQASNGTVISNHLYELILAYIFKYEGVGVYERYKATDGDNRPILSKLGTDYIFFCPNRNVAANAAAHGAPVYQYRFNHVLSFDPWGPEYPFCVGKVCHGSELPFEFHVAAPYFKFTNGEEYLSNQFIQWWGNFVKTGKPDSSTVWPAYESSSDWTMVMDVQSTAQQGVEADLCNWFDKIGYTWGTGQW